MMRLKNSLFLFLLAALATVSSGGFGAPPKSEECAKDVDCKGKKICVDGACVQPAAEEKPKSGCTSDTDCKGKRVCVKGECVNPPPKNKKGTPATGRSDEINQPGTNLYWLRCPLGQTWNGYACRGRADRRITWDMAIKACPAGYRLPTRKELIDVLGGCRPGVSEGARGYCAACGRSTNCYTMFGRDRLMYWSSTASATDPGVAWRVSFRDGGVGGDAMRAGRAVRCVRKK